MNVVIVVSTISLLVGDDGKQHDEDLVLAVPADNRAEARGKAKLWANRTYGTRLAGFSISSTETATWADPDEAQLIIPKKKTVQVTPTPSRYLKTFVVTLKYIPNSGRGEIKFDKFRIEAASSTRAIAKALRASNEPEGYSAVADGWKIV